MHAFLVAEDFTLRTSRFTRTYRGGAMTGEIPIDRLVVDTGGESDLVRKEMERQKAASSAGTGSGSGPDAAASDPGSSDEIKKNPYVIGVPESALLAWGPFPARLGRVSSRFIGKGLHRHEEPEPLPAQLAALKARHPGRRHFRFAVVNAFGTNLGDCTIGMTAMRAVAKRLERSLDSFVIDLLLGANTGQGNFDIAGYEPWIGQVRVTGPTVQDFADYDGYFDFTGLIALPRFTELPIVDWYLWWSGLDPDMVDRTEKRNRIHLRPDPFNEVARALQKVAAPRILLNAKSSVPLRTCPDRTAIAVGRHLLQSNKALNIILPMALDLSGARVHDLSAVTRKGTDYFNALVAQCDGVVSVDTYTIHCADAFDVPVVGLFASVPPDAYPYYPLHQGLLVPGGETLPAFRKSKVSAEEWETLKGPYEAAWAKLPCSAVSTALDAATEQRKTHRKTAPSFVTGAHKRPFFRQGPTGRVLRFEADDPLWHRAVARHIEIFKAVIRPGNEIAVVAPGQSHFLLIAAEHIGPEGRIHVFEPRVQRRKLIEMDLAEKVPQTPVVFYDSLPALGSEIEIANENYLNETTPLAWGTSRIGRKIETKSIDSMNCQNLSGIFIFAPMQSEIVTMSARSFLTKTRCPIVSGPMRSLDQVKLSAEALSGMGFQIFADDLARTDGGKQNIIIMALDSGVKVSAGAMKRVVLK